MDVLQGSLFMSAFINTFISAIVGALAAIGTTWYLSSASGAANLVNTGTNALKADEIEVERLIVGDVFTLVDSKTREPLVEIRNGSIYAQKGLYAENVGAWKMTSRQIQTTPEDPFRPNSPVFGELGVNDEGGAYLYIKSPKENHSVTIGFDASERGCVLSKNCADGYAEAQAIFNKPTPPSQTNVAQVAATRSANAAPNQGVRNAVNYAN